MLYDFRDATARETDPRKTSGFTPLRSCSRSRCELEWKLCHVPLTTRTKLRRSSISGTSLAAPAADGTKVRTL